MAMGSGRESTLSKEYRQLKDQHFQLQQKQKKDLHKVIVSPKCC